MTTLAKKNQQLEHQLVANQRVLEDRMRVRKGLEQVLENAAEALREVVVVRFSLGSHQTLSSSSYSSKILTIVHIIVLIILDSEVSGGRGSMRAIIK